VTDKQRDHLKRELTRLPCQVQKQPPQHIEAQIESLCAKHAPGAE
jgi:hypothetical protein